MTVPKEIPVKWFPIVLPLQRKKQRGLDGGKSKKRRTGTTVKDEIGRTDCKRALYLVLKLLTVLFVCWFVCLFGVSLIGSVSAAAERSL